jgi:hypothetical protein
VAKFLIVGFDGLRREDAVSGAMPNLGAFIRERCFCAGHRAVFPVETYVNHPSIFSGFLPRRHGVIANMYHNRPGANKRTAYFLGSSVDSIEANDFGGNLIEVPTIGRLLGERGLTMRVIGSNSSGSTRLKHREARVFPGHLNLPVCDLSKAVPQSEIAPFRELHGDGWPLSFPYLEGSKAVIDSFFEVEVKRGLADVTVLWLGEPDHSSHQDGPLGPKTSAALAQADSLFGEVADWWRREGGDTQLLTISDHGHVIIERYSHLKKALIDAGLRVAGCRDIEAGAPLEEIDLVMSGDYCSGLWLARDDDMRTLAKAIEALLASEDLGLLLTNRKDLETGIDSGIFPESLVLSDHQRSPDLRLVTRGDPKTNLIACEKGLAIGAGAHGGLLPDELNCLCAWGGDLFKEEKECRLPSGPADVAATILSLLGFGEKVVKGLDGRVLTECLSRQAPEKGPKPKAETIIRQKGGFRQVLKRTAYKGRVYLDCGYREL